MARWHDPGRRRALPGDHADRPGCCGPPGPTGRSDRAGDCTGGGRTARPTGGGRTAARADPAGRRPHRHHPGDSRPVRTRTAPRIAAPAARRPAGDHRRRWVIGTTLRPRRPARRPTSPAAQPFPRTGRGQERRRRPGPDTLDRLPGRRHAARRGLARRHDGTPATSCRAGPAGRAGRAEDLPAARYRSRSLVRGAGLRARSGRRTRRCRGRQGGLVRAQRSAAGRRRRLPAGRRFQRVDGGRRGRRPGLADRRVRPGPLPARCAGRSSSAGQPAGRAQPSAGVRDERGRPRSPASGRASSCGRLGLVVRAVVAGSAAAPAARRRRRRGHDRHRAVGNARPCRPPTPAPWPPRATCGPAGRSAGG